MTSPTERILLEQVAGGDKQAFGALYDLHSDALYQFVFRFVKSPDLANDVCQEIFMKIWEERQGASRINAFRTYLFTIAKNHTFTVLKRAAVDEKVRTEVIRNYVTVKNDTEESVLTSEYQQFLQQVLNTLPAQSRTVFFLCRQEEKSYEEAAQLLGISASAIKKHMVRSMKAMRGAVEKNMGIALGTFAEFLLQSGDSLFLG
jgi:RNA polymerase sigma-70 factor (ECF subfamily)